MIIDKYIDGGWALAVRRSIPGRLLYSSGDRSPFFVIKNPWGYWCADPFLLNYNGIEYIFCEAFDIFQNKGIIAYRTIDNNGKVSKLHPCLDCEGHLSYPFIFEKNGVVYMIPESGDANEIALYKAVKFPDKWEKESVLVKDVSACDTNLISYRDRSYLLTLIFDRQQERFVYDTLYVYQWNGTSFVKCRNGIAVKDAEYARNAGKMFFADGRLYRVSQNCKDMYGENLDFHVIDKLSEDEYQEHFAKRVSLNDIPVNNGKKYDGIHTYNHDDRYEIVDLQKNKWFRVERFLFLIRNKLREAITRGKNDK